MNFRNSKNKSQISVCRNIKIGVTGPSKINDIKSVEKRLNNILDNINQKLKQTPYHLIIVSPLARGSDRMLTERILEFEPPDRNLDSCLEIISQNNLENESDYSEIRELIKISKSNRNLYDILNDKSYANIAEDYSYAGQLVVDHCDCLIAIGDLEKKEGHTHKIITYAKINSHPTFLIPNIGSNKIDEYHTKSFWEDLEYLNEYNNENIIFNKIKAEINKKDGLLELVDLSDAEKNVIKYNIISPLSKANILAMHYQKRHYWSVNLVYFASAGAVAIVASQLLFFPEIPTILIVEAILMILIILIYFWNKKEDWHRKWIDYRYLAERLRAATIFAIAGLQCNISQHLPYARSGDDWTFHAYKDIYQKPGKNLCERLDFEKKREFIIKNWIEIQQQYYEKKSNQYKKTEKRLNQIILVLFALTAIFALIHAMGVFWNSLEIPVISEFMTLMVIVFPAIAASCAGIKIQHEYLRISKRYLQMVNYLKTLKFQIKQLEPDEEEKLVIILENANKMMLREHQDWRAIFAVRNAELP